MCDLIPLSGIVWSGTYTWLVGVFLGLWVPEACVVVFIVCVLCIEMCRSDTLQTEVEFLYEMLICVLCVV